MDKTYNELEVRKLVISGIVIFGIIEIAFIRVALPSHYTNYLLFIPAYFLLLGISALMILSRIKRKRLHPGRAIARLMLYNISQMLLSFILMICYYYFIDVKEHTILIAFSIFYVFFMSIKFFILYNIDHRHNIDSKRMKHVGNIK